MGRRSGLRRYSGGRGLTWGNVTRPRRHRLVGLVSLPVRISAVTLACRDIGRMSAFYRQFGWPEAPSSVPEHVVFQCANGVVLGLFSETVFERQFGGVGEGFRGFSLSINCEDPRGVFRAHEQIRDFDDLADLDEQPEQSGWGCGFTSVTPKATSGTLPSKTVPTSITAAVSSTPDTANAGVAGKNAFSDNLSTLLARRRG